MSTRFGKNKLLQPVNDETMIRRVVRVMLESAVDEVVVVVGYQAARIRRALRGLACRVVENTEYELGQSSSVKVGVAAVTHNATTLVVIPGDIALVRPAHVNLVIEEYRRTLAPIVVASFQGRYGHPILFDRSLFERILAIDEQSFGLKAIVDEYRDRVRTVEVGSRDVLVDIDTVRDFRKYMRGGVAGEA